MASQKELGNDATQPPDGASNDGSPSNKNQAPGRASTSSSSDSVPADADNTSSPTIAAKKRPLSPPRKRKSVTFHSSAKDSTSSHSLTRTSNSIYGTMSSSLPNNPSSTRDRDRVTEWDDASPGTLPPGVPPLLELSPDELAEEHEDGDGTRGDTESSADERTAIVGGSATKHQLGAGAGAGGLAGSYGAAASAKVVGQGGSGFEPGQGQGQGQGGRRRKSSGRRGSLRKGGGGGGQGGDGEGQGQGKEEKWWSKYSSVELENKGSVARDHLALERTFLAWLRTSLAFASIGIAITQLFRLNTSLARQGQDQNGNSPTPKLRHVGKPLGATFLAIAILVLFIGFHRYFEAQYYVIRGKFPASRGSIMLVAGVAGALIVTSLVVVLSIAPTAFEKR